MRIHGEQMWKLLRSLDDPDNLEFPAGYDHDQTRRQFDELVSQLDAASSCRCAADRHVEDASLHARAIGSDLAGRLRVCAAPAFDRVFVDVARNAQRRFCAPQCQSRVKAAAHRARKAAS